MWPAIAAMAAAQGLQTWGGMSSAREASQQSAENMRWQIETEKMLQARSMEFQERMSNTAHQREVADLKAAGLNPILSVNSGASTPSVGIPSISQPQVFPQGNWQNVLGSMLSTVLPSVSALTEIRKKDAEADLALAGVSGEAARSKLEESELKLVPYKNAVYGRIWKLLDALLPSAKHMDELGSSGLPRSGNAKDYLDVGPAFPGFGAGE